MTSKRIQELKTRIAFAEPYKEWKCNDHNMYGSGGTRPFACCEEELAQLLYEKDGECPYCGAKKGRWCGNLLP